jgi:hypothetical protein
MNWLGTGTAGPRPTTKELRRPWLRSRCQPAQTLSRVARHRGIGVRPFVYHRTGPGEVADRESLLHDTSATKVEVSGSQRVPGSWFSLPAPVPVRTEPPLSELLDPEATLDRIGQLHAHIAVDELARPAPGSKLAADDAALDPYHLSHAIMSAVGISIDHLEAFRVLTQDARRTQPAHYTLLRSALEGASTAVWLASPEDAKERRFRRLRLAANDIWESGEAQKLHGLPRPSGRTTAQLREGLRKLAPDDRDVLAGHWSYRQVIRAAAENRGIDPDVAELLWRAESGLAHGALWATLGMLNREQSDSDVPGVVHLRTTANVEQLVLAAAFALATAEFALRLYDSVGA